MFFSAGGMPFMFSGMGGMPGMGADDDDDEGHGGAGGGGGAGEKKEVDNTKFYTVLGLEKDATAAEIRKAYLVLSRKEHPDRGGDPEKFKEISKAYECLSDPDKRARYDRFGEDGADGGGGGPSSMEEMLAGMFGRGRGPTGALHCLVLYFAVLRCFALCFEDGV